MAKLKAQVGGTGIQIENLAPAGQHVAVCLRVNDQFGVERPSFSNPQVTEFKDVTRFIFGLFGADKRPYLVQTYEFTISSAPGGNLSKFLKGWLGVPAQIGWDYCEQLGKPALITVAHTPSKKNPGQIYADITGISPLPGQMLQFAPSAVHFETMIKALEQDQPAQPPAGAPPALPPQQYTPPPPAPPAYVPPPAPANFAPPPPPPAPTAFTPPPPPAPVERKFYVHFNNAVTPVPQAQLMMYPPTTPAMAEGDTTWSTVAALTTPAGPGGQPGAINPGEVPF